MPSPFPGMDPYIELSGFWPDFHSTFMNVWREAIVDQLRPEYVAMLDEQLVVMEYDDDKGAIRSPDIVVSREPSGGIGTLLQPAASGGTLQADRIAAIVSEEIRETSIQIRRTRDRKLVTVLELLSPANKFGRGLKRHQAKRDAIMNSEVHLVELDLLIAGQRMKLGKPLPQGHYYYIVSRENDRPICDVYSWNVRDPLPTLPVPLHERDPDIFINLADVFTETFRRARYERSIDYRAQLSPSLPTEDRDWIRGVAFPEDE